MNSIRFALITLFPLSLLACAGAPPPQPAVAPTVATHTPQDLDDTTGHDRDDLRQYAEIMNSACATNEQKTSTDFYRLYRCAERAMEALEIATRHAGDPLFARAREPALLAYHYYLRLGDVKDPGAFSRYRCTLGVFRKIDAKKYQV